MSKQTFTAVVVRPDYLAETYGLDVYVAYVEAKDTASAGKKAKKQAYRADTFDGLRPDHADDYAISAIFKGAPKLLVVGNYA